MTPMIRPTVILTVRDAVSGKCVGATVMLTMKSLANNKKIFISGSRAMVYLNETVCENLRGIIDKQFTVLVGDAGGADKAVQTFVRGEGYTNVVVYCMGDKCRNNVGDWEVCAIEANGARKDFSYFAQKDAAMSRDADYGLMLWDGKSKGTLNNALNMLEQGKPSRVYFAVDDKMVNIKSAGDVEALVAKCGDEARAYFDKAIKFSKRVQYLQQVQSQQGKPQQSERQHRDIVAESGVN